MLPESDSPGTMPKREKVRVVSETPPRLPVRWTKVHINKEIRNYTDHVESYLYRTFNLSKYQPTGVLVNPL